MGFPCVINFTIGLYLWDNMEIEIISESHDEYLDFIIGGLRSYERANNCIEKIQMFHSSISVTYKENPESVTELLYIHDHIQDYGMTSFISTSDIKEGNSIRYDLEE